MANPVSNPSVPPPFLPPLPNPLPLRERGFSSVRTVHTFFANR
jgi:hypothetical protein